MADFFWGPNGQRISATQAERNRKTADALRGRVQKPQTYWEGLQSIVGDVGGSLLDWQADQAQEAGRQEVADALAAAQAGEDPNGYLTVLANEWASPSQSAVASALLNRGWDIEDRNAGWARDDANRKSDRDWERSMLDMKRGWELEDVQSEREHNQPLFDAQLEGQNLNNETGRFTLDQAKTGFRPLTDPDERAQYGIDPTDPRVWQVGPDNKAFPSEAGKTGAGAGGSWNFDDVSGIRKEIQSLPSYKNFAQALPIYKAMVETAGRDTRASDLNLVYGLGKIMDPTSVVREGEMFMVQGINTLPEKLIEGVNSLLTGTSTLSPETRKTILTEAFGRTKGYEEQFTSDAASYRGLAERYSINPDDILPAFSAVDPWEPDSAKDKPAPTPRDGAVVIKDDAEFEALPPGTLFIGPDGVKRRKP